MEKEVFITEEEKDKPEKIEHWDKVEHYLREGSLSSLVLAVIEAEKIFKQTLKDSGFPGKTTEEKISQAGGKISNITKLNFARNLRRDILEKINPAVTSLDLEAAVLAYKQAVIDLKEGSSKISFSDKVIFYVDYYFPNKLKSLKKTGIYFVIFLAVVWLFANTAIGQGIINIIVGFANFIFSWIFAVLLLVLALAIVVILSLVYFERRKKQKL